jgi:hypothetical protein
MKIKKNIKKIIRIKITIISINMENKQKLKKIICCRIVYVHPLSLIHNHNSKMNASLIHLLRLKNTIIINKSIINQYKALVKIIRHNYKLMT